MADIKRKEVKISSQFDLDIIDLYVYGEEMFGSIAAKSFIADIYSRIWSLDLMYLLHVECRHLPTKDKRYRNIILGSYLIIYRISSETIEVLRIFHSHSSIKKIRTTRTIISREQSECSMFYDSSSDLPMRKSISLVTGL